MTLTEERLENHTYERVHLRSGVFVIPMNEKREILLIKEKRKHEGEIRWKIITGWVDKKHVDPEQIAREELAEEAQMQCQEMQQVYEVPRSKQTISTHEYYYIAKNCSDLAVPINNPDGDIVLDMKWVSESEYLELIDSQEIQISRNTGVIQYIFRDF